MQSRRNLLRTAAGLATVTLAGCSRIPGNGDSDTAAGRYQEFVYRTPARPLSIVGQKIGELASIEAYTGIRESGTALGLPATEADYGVEVTTAGIPRTPPTYAVLLGPIDFETVRADLEGEGTLTELDERGGFRTLRLETADETRFFGVDDRTGVMAQSRDHFESVVEAVHGNRALVVEESDTFESLAETVGEPSYVSARIGPEQTYIDGADVPAGSIVGIDVGEVTSEYTTAVRYASEQQAAGNESVYREALVEAITELQNVETEIDGRMLLVTATVPTTVVGEIYG